MFQMHVMENIALILALVLFMLINVFYGMAQLPVIYY